MAAAALFLMSSLNVFCKVRVGVLSFERSVRDTFVLVFGILQVGSLTSSREHEKSGRTCLFSKFSFAFFFGF